MKELYKIERTKKSPGVILIADKRTKKLPKSNDIEIERINLTEILNEISAEMDEEMAMLGEDDADKMLKNYVRGRKATCEDVLRRIIAREA